MTDLAAALAAKLLTPFEGTDVISAGMELPGAAGGLREALAFAPIEVGIGDEVFLVFKTSVKKIRFDPIKDTDCLSRVHVLEVLESVIVDGADVDELLANQRERVKLAREAAAGISRLAFEEDLAEQEAAAMAEESAEKEGSTDDDGYYDPAPPAAGTTDISTATPRKRAPRKPKP